MMIGLVDVDDLIDLNYYELMLKKATLSKSGVDVFKRRAYDKNDVLKYETKIKQNFKFEINNFDKNFIKIFSSNICSM